MLAMDLNDIKQLDNPFQQKSISPDLFYSDLIKKQFWNGKYFYDDASHKNYLAGDANIFPFLLGIIKDRDKMQSALAEILKAGLDKPLPLKYTISRDKVQFVWQEKFALRAYESNAVWTNIG